jgi:diguanylate cyclase (GGDEF)-like protein
VVYVLAPLLLHVAFYRFGTPDPDLRITREALVLGLTTILACMTLIYHRLLRIENRRLADKEVLARENLVHQAFHDELTGLPNRNLFSDRLRLAMAHCQRYESKCCVMFCDLDQFKVINDSLGHEAGDEVLVAVAQRLRGSIRGQDTVARFGGDEFAIMVQDMHRVMDIALVAEKLLSALARPLVVNGKSHVLTASIGISIFPDDAEEVETLLNHADTAMYQAKLHGRNTYRHFTEAMNEAARERLAIEQGLRAGLMADRFVVFYQPIVELPSGKAIGYEALLRWNHPERAYITPVNFLDVAEQTGLIVPIGRWVLETACRWAMELDTSIGLVPSISVNLSARQFRDPGLIQDVARVLARTGLEPARLQLEISETMALTIDSTAIALKGLQELGVRVAIDDFGTGYASLSHLQELPVDVVKIDKSFVRGIEIDSVREAIVQAIVNMARALNFYVVAEGVETARELEIIQQSQCDAAQGYYLCEPLPPQELKEIMARPNPWLGFKSEPEDPDQ